MNTRLRKILTAVGMSAAVALAASACASGSASPSTGSSIDCSKSLADRVAQVNKADAAVDVDTKALTKAKGTPDEAAAKSKLDADTATAKKLQDENKACASPSTSASPSPSNEPADWTTIYYSKLPGVPTGYFGPKSACIQTKSPDDCRTDLETTWKHDPDILSVWLVHFNLLPGQQDLVAKLTAEHQSQTVIDQQVEVLRQKFAKTLADYKQRKVWQPKAAAVLDSIPDLTIQPLSGVYYTTYIDTSGAVHQTTKNMNPAINVAIKGTLPSGQAFEDKLDCHHQPVSKKPIPNVPTGPPPTQTPTPSPTPTPPSCHQGCTPTPSHTPCPKCVTTPTASQTVPTPRNPFPSSTVKPPYNPPTQAPSTGPAPDPEPTGPGYNSGGGAGSAPGDSTCNNGSCDRTSPSPTTSPSPNPGNGGVTHSPDPGNGGMPPMPG